MKITEFCMKPLADDLSIAGEHRSNQRIRAHASPPPLSESQSALQKVSIGG